MLQFSNFEDTDSDMESVSSFIDDESGSDEVNFSLEKVQESVSIPIIEEGGIGKRYAVIAKLFNCKGGKEISIRGKWSHLFRSAVSNAQVWIWM